MNRPTKITKELKNKVSLIPNLGKKIREEVENEDNIYKFFLNLKIPVY